MGLTRVYDWRAKFTQYITAARGKPFDEATHNCATFFAGGVQALTGVDMSRWLGMEYRSIAEGLVQLRALGFESHVELVARSLPEIPPAMASVGDGMLMPSQDGPALGLCQGPHVYAVTKGGLTLMSRQTALRAFKIG